MVNVIKNSVLHTYAKGDNTSVFYRIGADTPKIQYEELIAQIVHINRFAPCTMWLRKGKNDINFSFPFISKPDGFGSSRLTLDFMVEFRNPEEFDWAFSNIYNYITSEIGCSVSDFFRTNENIPFVSEEKDHLHLHIKSNMLKIAEHDILDNCTILIDYPSTESL